MKGNLKAIRNKATYKQPWISEIEWDWTLVFTWVLNNSRVNGFGKWTDSNQCYLCNKHPCISITFDQKDDMHLEEYLHKNLWKAPEILEKVHNLSKPILEKEIPLGNSSESEEEVIDPITKQTVIWKKPRKNTVGNLNPLL